MGAVDSVLLDHRTNRYKVLPGTWHLAPEGM